eukprot:TRINITY_DN6585_c0_g1_i1.p1 TRINITY_DN6585_c0_g1~~TRINITY_DN6585_c0_g1_i1.p1  ORF type:complete len:431 (-),score=121.89 TRINITY_DN6585_c0_g1_i1:95-1387(-)
MRESNQKEIELKNISPYIFGLILDYFYLGKCKVEAGQLLELYCASNEYMIEHLSEWCINELEEVLSTRTCLELLNSVRKMEKEEIVGIDLNDFVKQLFELIILETDECIKTKSFLSITEKDLIKILESDELNCDEKVLFDRTMEWVDKNREKGSLNIIDQLLYLLRIPTISAKDLSNISNNEIARESKLFYEIVLLSYQYQIQPKSMRKSPFMMTLDSETMFKSRTQLYTYKGETEWYEITSDGNYIINCKGANGNTDVKGGLGSEIQSIFCLKKGDILEILVGEHLSSDMNHGGGGSFVFLNNTKRIDKRDPLIVAGGGGGCNINEKNLFPKNYNASLQTSGNTGTQCTCKLYFNGENGLGNEKGGLGWKGLKEGRGDDPKRTFGGGGYCRGDNHGAGGGYCGGNFCSISGGGGGSFIKEIGSEKVKNI